jgi:ATP-dependent DNA ligase
MARRDSVGIRLLTRNAHEWTDRYPAVVAAMNHLPVKSCLIDGEVVACDENGLAIFDMLRHGPRRKSNALLSRIRLAPTRWRRSAPNAD